MEETKLRTEISDKFKWDLTQIYKNIEDFECDYSLVEKHIVEIQQFKGELKKIPKLKECLDLSTLVDKVITKLYCYANMYLDQEQNNEDADKLVQKVKDISIKYSSIAKFITDEIINFNQKTIDKVLSSKKLELYHFNIKDTLKNKKHILSKIEEELLTKISDVFSTSNDVYTIFKNTELKYSRVTLSTGEEVLVDDRNYRVLLESSNRDDRKLIYDTFYKTYDDYKVTLSKLMFKFIKSSATRNNIRKYNSSLESALSGDDIPVSIYDGLIDNISNNLDKMFDYLNLRKKILCYDDLYYYDLYNPIVDNVNYEYSYDDAKDLLIKSTEILGDDYTKIMKQSISEGWIDVYPNQFKDTGAYMNGSVYDVHPYILLNYKGKYDDVSTMLHEAGHAGHSVLSTANQPYNKASYSTFIAEIASTTNELLLLNYMMTNTEDKQLKIFLLNNYIEHFRTTVFRQTMFAEFEKFMYETVENGEVLTASLLNDKYYELLKKYHGEEQNIITIDKLYANEWSRIPHFYYDFYVFQYSTSFISAVILSRRIINGDKEQLEKYMTLLKSGGSDYPIELLRKAGIDLTDGECYKDAFKQFSEYLTELKMLLEK